MIVAWSQTAREQLLELTAYISEDSPRAADALFERIVSATHSLTEHPYMCRLGRAPGTRELVVHPNYIVVYQVLLDRIDIVSVVHARREYP